MCACFALLQHKSHGILRARVWVQMMHRCVPSISVCLPILAAAVWAKLALLGRLVLTGCYARRPQYFLHFAVASSTHRWQLCILVCRSICCMHAVQRLTAAATGLPSWQVHNGGHYAVASETVSTQVFCDCTQVRFTVWDAGPALWACSMCVSQDYTNSNAGQSLYSESLYSNCLSGLETACVAPLLWFL